MKTNAGSAPRKPLVKVSDSTASVYNDPALTRRVADVLRRTLGKSNVIQQPPITASDDFAEYGRAGVPSLQFELGAVDPQKFAAARKSGKPLPGVHSPFFAPDREPSLRTGILAETAAVLDLLQKK